MYAVYISIQYRCKLGLQIMFQTIFLKKFKKKYNFLSCASAIRLPTCNRDLSESTCRWPSPHGERVARAALKYNSHRAAGYYQK
jgi:hypothetical protein